jgi:hypothetical protein
MRLICVSIFGASAVTRARQGGVDRGTHNTAVAASMAIVVTRGNSVRGSARSTVV